MRGPLALLAVVGPGEPGAVSCGPIGLLLAGAEAREARDPAKRHSRICAAAKRGPVLPARRGAAFSDLAAARRWAEQRAQTLSEGLAKIAARAEFVVTLAPPPPAARAGAAASSAAGPGARYLRERAASQPPTARAAEAARAALQALASELADALPAQIAGRRIIADPAQGLADLSLLAPRDAGDALAEAVAARRAEARVTGPWPPYSFAEIPT